MTSETSPGRVLCTYGDLSVGGIETLIVRYANHLARVGREVAVCCSGGELLEYFSPDVRVLTWSRRREAIAKSLQWISESASPVQILSFDPISAALALAIETQHRGPASLIHISGVFHPRTYFMDGERRDRILLNRLVASATGYERIFYMNSECRNSHANRWGLDLSQCPFIPVPIERQMPAWRAGTSRNLHIVSVGRLIAFKAYNLGAIDVVDWCARQGIDIRWDIYGSGPDYNRIRSGIAARGLEQRIQLKGNLPYRQFSRTVASHDLFIGMGTAALESAMLGVPTIVATDNEPQRCYGFVYDLPFGNVGERQEFPPPFSFSDLIAGFAQADPDKRRQIGDRCRAAVEPYTIERFVEQVDSIVQNASPTPSLLFKRLASALYEMATDSSVIRWARAVHDRWH